LGELSGNLEEGSAKVQALIEEQATALNARVASMVGQIENLKKTLGAKGAEIGGQIKAQLAKTLACAEQTVNGQLAAIDAELKTASGAEAEALLALKTKLTGLLADIQKKVEGCGSAGLNVNVGVDAGEAHTGVQIGANGNGISTGITSNIKLPSFSF